MKSFSGEKMAQEDPGVMIPSSNEHISATFTAKMTESRGGSGIFITLTLENGTLTITSCSVDLSTGRKLSERSGIYRLIAPKTLNEFLLICQEEVAKYGAEPMS
jgi:hypothetical protein